MNREVLEQIRPETMIALYLNIEDTSSFVVGYLVEISDDHILLAAVDTHGNSDGYIVCCIENVYLIEKDNAYVNKLDRLYRMKSQSHDELTRMCSNELDLIVFILRSAREQQRALSIQLLNSGYTDTQGLAKEFTDKEVLIQNIGDTGTDDGVSWIVIDTITRIDYDSQNEKDLLVLRQ